MSGAPHLLTRPPDRHVQHSFGPSIRSWRSPAASLIKASPKPVAEIDDGPDPGGHRAESARKIKRRLRS
jgi:hypothetical protein